MLKKNSGLRAPSAEILISSLPVYLRKARWATLQLGPTLALALLLQQRFSLKVEGCAETASRYPASASQGLLISRTPAASVPGKHA